MFSKLSSLKKGKGKQQEQEIPPPRRPSISAPYLAEGQSSGSSTPHWPAPRPAPEPPQPYYEVYGNILPLIAREPPAADAWIPPPSPQLFTQEEEDAHFAQALAKQEARLAKLHVEENEWAARAIMEQEQREEREKEEEAERMLQEMLDREEVEEAEIAAERERRERECFDELKREADAEAESRRAVLVCETCEGRFFEGEAVMVQCSEGHVICAECASMGVKVRFGELDASLRCLVDFGVCVGTYTPEETRKFLDDEQQLHFGKLRLKSDLEGVEGLTRCPHCDYAVLIEDPEMTVLECRNDECRKKTCIKCEKPAHGKLTCLQANPPAAIHDLEEKMSEALIRSCPSCKKVFVKNGGCNKISCTCGTKSCYLCRVKVDNYNHWDTGPCRGKLYDDKGVQAGVERVRQDGLKELVTEDERKHFEALK